MFALRPSNSAGPSRRSRSLGVSQVDLSLEPLVGELVYTVSEGDLNRERAMATPNSLCADVESDIAINESGFDFVGRQHRCLHGVAHDQLIIILLRPRRHRQERSTVHHQIVSICGHEPTREFVGQRPGTRVWKYV